MKEFLKDPKLFVMKRFAEAKDTLAPAWDAVEAAWGDREATGKKVATLGEDLSHLFVKEIEEAYAKAAGELYESMNKLRKDPIQWSKTAAETVTAKSNIAVTTLH